MDFDPEPDHEEIVQSARSFSTALLPRLPRNADAFFREAYAALAARGSFEPRVEAVHAARVAMSLADVSGSLALTFAIGHGFVRASRRLAVPGSFASEPSASSAAAQAARPTPRMGVIAAATLEEKSGDAAGSRGATELAVSAPVVRGGTVASHAILFTGARARAPYIACIDLSAAGLVRRASAGVLGFDRVPACSIDAGGVAIEPAAALRGEPALEALREIRSSRRTLAAAVAVGIGRRAFRVAVEHLRALGTRASQSTEFSLSDVATELDAAELSTLRAAWLDDSGADSTLESASAKLLSARAATRAAHAALEITGDSRYTDELRRCYLDACALESLDGTTAEQHDTIASAMLEE